MRCTFLVDVSNIIKLPIIERICVCACWEITSSVAPSGSCRKLLFNQDNLIVFSLITFEGGKDPNNCCRSGSKSPLLTIVIGSPSMRRSNCNVISSKVTMDSPCGRRKVCVSVLHLSINAMIKWWLMSIFGIVSNSQIYLHISNLSLRNPGTQHVWLPRWHVGVLFHYLSILS